MTSSTPYPKSTLFAEREPRRFSGEDAVQVAMPLGGIGAGCVCLNAQGGLQDFSIRNVPATSALPDGHSPTDAAFATVYFPDRGLARLLEGPLPSGRIYNQGLKSQGARSGGHEGLPRFRRAVFQGEYPFGTVELTDPDLPLAVTITGFNPFIPLDDKNSSLPCAILEYTFTNATEQVAPFEFSYHISHFAFGEDGGYAKTRNGVVEDDAEREFRGRSSDAERGSSGRGGGQEVRWEPRKRRMRERLGCICIMKKTPTRRCLGRARWGWWGSGRWSRRCGSAAAGSTASRRCGKKSPRGRLPPTTACGQARRHGSFKGRNGGSIL